jgi:hypothetical protein
MYEFIILPVLFNGVDYILTMIYAKSLIKIYMEIRNKLTYIDPTKQFKVLKQINKSDMLKNIIKTNDIIGHASDAYVLISKNNERQREIENSKKYQYVKKEQIDITEDENKKMLLLAPLLFTPHKKERYAIYKTDAINISKKQRKQIDKQIKINYPIFGSKIYPTQNKKIIKKNKKSSYALYKIQNFLKNKKSFIPNILFKKRQKYATI